MRRLLIQHVLPLLLCLVPVLAAALVAAATPSAALDFYLEHLRGSRIDWLILGLGLPIFAIQVILSWRALHWRDTGFDERADPWLSNLAQATEWFPLLGLIGTVTNILVTFSVLAAPREPGTQEPGTQEIVRLYAPALTATGSGLVMALINIFPTWMVQIGRDMITSLGGGESEAPASRER